MTDALKEKFPMPWKLRPPFVLDANDAVILDVRQSDKFTDDQFEVARFVDMVHRGLKEL